MLKDQRTVRYEDFMNAVSEKTYFDSNHRIISLSQEKLDAILETWESPVELKRRLCGCRSAQPSLYFPTAPAGGCLLETGMPGAHFQSQAACL